VTEEPHNCFLIGFDVLKKITLITLSAAVFGWFLVAQIDHENRDSADQENINNTRKLDPTSLRTTESGPVLGFSDLYDTHAWLGIPYAAAPLNELRWRAPQPVTKWTSSLEALKASSVCVQPRIVPSAGIVGSEDCLYLNVWAPVSAAVNAAQIEQQLPVMLWIHGGENTVGSAQRVRGHRLASEQQVVFVSVNYRLGYLGYFSHRALRNNALNQRDASGNFGTLDIIAALNWVQKNIANFGGDNNNITIFGESSGARNVVALLASPIAEGLFHKAIVQSGSLRTESTQSAENFIDDPQPGQNASSSELIAQLLIDLGAATDRNEAKADIAQMNDASLVAFLRTQSATDILHAASHNRFSHRPTQQVPQLIRDGIVLPLEPLTEVFGHPTNYNNVPVIIGSNRDEAKSSMALDADYVQWRFGLWPHILNPQNYATMASLRSSRSHLLAVEQPARLLSSSRIDVDAKSNIFTSRFDWDELPSNWLLDMPQLIGAGKAIEIGFVFGDFAVGSALANRYAKQGRPNRDALSAAIMDYWGNFAHFGSPATGRSGAQPQWQPWKEDSVNTMIFDSPESRGWRMQERQLNVASLTQQLLDESTLTDQKTRCKLYLELFLNSDQSSDHWHPETYRNLPGGCKYQQIQRVMRTD
jgi:para-nitrobenzyl esterase